MYDHLEKRGWSKEELDHLKKNFWIKEEKILLSVLGIALLLATIIGVPFAYGFLGQILPEALFQIMIFMIGLPLGWMFGVFLVDFDRLSHKHHILLIIWTPIIAIAAAMFAFIQINTMTLPGGYTHNALIGALVYAISFMIPYGYLVKHEWNSRIGSSNT